MIRNLNEKDFDEYYRVRLQALEQFPVAYSSMPKFFKECPKEKHLSLLEDSGSDSSFFVKGYFENDKLLGVIGMLPESRESVDHKGSLWGFYVDPNQQGKARQGKARELVESCYLPSKKTPFKDLVNTLKEIKEKPLPKVQIKKINSIIKKCVC